MILASKGPRRFIGGRLAIRNLVTVACMLSCFLFSLQAGADSCKPDVSNVDKITKQQNDVWVQRTSATGLGASLMGTTDVSVFITVGRYGGSSAVNVEILKEEASASSATFDSSLHAAKGNSFFLGFKDGGEPLSFVATDVGNETKVRDDVLDFGKGKVVTTVILSSAVSDETLATMRGAVTTKQMDAIRVRLVGGVMIEKSIDDKSGKKLMEKFLCFYQSGDKRGLDRSAPVNDSGRMVAVQGRYVRKGKTTDIFELNPDGTAAVFQDGQIVHGNYTVQGDTISFTSPELPGQTSKGRVTGDTFKDDEGIVWEKLTEAQRAGAPPIPKGPAATAPASSALGKYILKGGTYYMELKSDGTIACQMSPNPAILCSGTYKIQGDLIRVTLPWMATNLHLVGNTLVGKTQIWEKQAETPRIAPPTVVSAPVTLRLGMTPEQVEAAQGGKPQKVIDLGSKKTYVYPDMKIIFVDGKVTDIQ